MVLSEEKRARLTDILTRLHGISRDMGVRMFCFKLEGGEWFKEGFHKLFLDRMKILCKKPDLGIQFAKNKAQNRK